MSDVKEDLQPVTDGREGTLARLTNPIHENDTAVGGEAEILFFDLNTGQPTSGKISRKIYETANKEGLFLDPEGAANMIEVNGAPFTCKEGGSQKAASDITDKINHLVEIASRFGQVPSPFGFTATAKPHDLQADALKEYPRIKLLLNYYEAHAPWFIRMFSTGGASQISLSGHNIQETAELFAITSFLTPLIATLLSTAPPFTISDDGKRYRKVEYNLGLARRTFNIYNANKGIIECAFPGLEKLEKLDENSAMTFARHWNDLRWDSPFEFIYVIEDGKSVPKYVSEVFPKRNTITLDEVAKSRPDLIFQQNATLFLKPRSLIQISHRPAYTSAITDCTYPIGCRIEDRSIDTGSTEHHAANMVLKGLILHNPEFREAIKRFLKSFGFDVDRPAQSIPELRETLIETALKKYNDLADMPYGNNTIKTASQNFAQVLAPYIETYPELTYLQNLAEHGINQQLIFREDYGDTPEEFIKYHHTFLTGYNNAKNANAAFLIPDAALN